MPLTKEELMTTIKMTQNKWAFIDGISDDNLENGTVPSWQFRLTIKPTRANTIKALNVIASLPQFSNKPHLACKVMLPSDNSDLSGWDGTIEGGDRDQRGKEICVSVPYSAARIKPDFYNGDYPSKEYLKSLMCTMWKALQDAGVEMAYTPFNKDERELSSDHSITPFAYSSFKPFKQRHGILLATDFNPLKLEDPLEGVSITAEDLRNYGIHPLVKLKSAQRLVYQINHYNVEKEHADIDLKNLIERTSLPDRDSSKRAVYDTNIGYQNKLTDLSNLAADKQTTDITLKERILSYCVWVQEKTPQILLPSRTSLDDKLFTRHLNLLEDLAKESNISDAHLRKKYLSALPPEIQKKIIGLSTPEDNQLFRILVDEFTQDIQKGFNEEMDASVAEMVELTKDDPSITGEKLATAYKLYPQEFQCIYQRLAHLGHEKALILKESDRLDQFPKVFNHPQSYKDIIKNNPDPVQQARDLLNDYTKNNSVLSRTIHFHWNRHHIKAVNEIVKDIDQGKIQSMVHLIERLGAIPLQNPNGSLARRIKFIAMPYVEKMMEQFKNELETGPVVSIVDKTTAIKTNSKEKISDTHNYKREVAAIKTDSDPDETNKAQERPEFRSK